MDEEQESIYQEGYGAYFNGESEESNPYDALNSEFWSDGWDDAKEDQNIR